jgi:hypothetical protein
MAGKYGCTGTAHGGGPCNAHPIRGTDRCKRCCGTTVADQKAKGAVVLELRRWGLNGHDELADPGQTLLKLITQSAARAEHYAALLEQAYDAAEELRRHHEAGALLAVDEDTLGGDGEDDDYTEPPSIQAARATLDRIFTTGGVGALIGSTYSSTPAGHVYETGEAIRGLVQLEAQERDRCANFAVKGIAAGLAERQVRLAERQGALVADVLRAVLADLGLDPAAPHVVQVVSTRLAALGAVS